MILPSRFLLLNTGAKDGFTNMALDIDLAHQIAEGREKPVLRFYQWSPYAISLGYHQSIHDINTTLCRKEGIDVVHRPTGGRAIFHAEELTYSIVLPKSNISVSTLYHRISMALAEGLRYLDVPVEFTSTQPNFRQSYKSTGSIPCFSASARNELQVAGRKLVGSAQRRFSNAILQHGSILMGDMHLRLPDFLSIEEIKKKELSEILREKTITLRDILHKNISFYCIAKALQKGFEKEWEITFDMKEEFVNN